jgi:membrane protease YdiL (CAAX protease family)
MAAGIVAVITGAAHVDKGQTAMDVFGLFALTGFGRGVFSWLIARWQSLWFPFALHMFMNLWGGGIQYQPECPGWLVRPCASTRVRDGGDYCD